MNRVVSDLSIVPSEIKDCIAPPPAVYIGTGPFQTSESLFCIRKKQVSPPCPQPVYDQFTLHV